MQSSELTVRRRKQIEDPFKQPDQRDLLDPLRLKEAKKVQFRSDPELASEIESISLVHQFGAPSANPKDRTVDRRQAVDAFNSQVDSVVADKRSRGTNLRDEDQQVVKQDAGRAVNRNIARNTGGVTQTIDEMDKEADLMSSAGGDSSQLLSSSQNIYAHGGGTGHITEKDSLDTRVEVQTMTAEDVLVAANLGQRMRSQQLRSQVDSTLDTIVSDAMAKENSNELSVGFKELDSLVSQSGNEQKEARAALGKLGIVNEQEQEGVLEGLDRMRDISQLKQSHVTGEDVVRAAVEAKKRLSQEGVLMDAGELLSDAEATMSSEGLKANRNSDALVSELLKSENVRGDQQFSQWLKGIMRDDVNQGVKQQ